MTPVSPRGIYGKILDAYSRGPRTTFHLLDTSTPPSTTITDGFFNETARMIQNVTDIAVRNSSDLPSNNDDDHPSYYWIVPIVCVAAGLISGLAWWRKRAKALSMEGLDNLIDDGL